MDDLKLKRTNHKKDRDAVRKKLYVKYMLCSRDKLLVKSILNTQKLDYRISVHGAIELYDEVTQVQVDKLGSKLSKSCMVLLDEKESMLIDRIINTIIEVIHYSDTLPKLTFKDFVNELSVSGNESILKIFSNVKGMSVLQFIVIQKIERAKEMLLYEDIPIQEIADLLNYKSEDLLKAQFKKTTGLELLYFKQLKKERMKIAEKNNSTSYSRVKDSGASFYIEL